MKPPHENFLRTPLSVVQKNKPFDHVLKCPIHRPPHVLHGVTVLDDETIEWLLNTCLEIYRCQQLL